MSTNQTYDARLALDEARRAGTHDSAKSQADAEVKSELSAVAPHATGRVDAVAKGLHERAVDEVVQTEHEVGRARTVARISQVVDYGFMVLYALLAVRFVLALLAARSGSAFVRFIVALTEPFYAPFKGVVDSPRIDGGHTVIVPLLVALAAYGLLHLGVNGLLRLFARRKTSV